MRIAATQRILVADAWVRTPRISKMRYLYICDNVVLASLGRERSAGGFTSLAVVLHQ